MDGNGKTKWKSILFNYLLPLIAAGIFLAADQITKAYFRTLPEGYTQKVVGDFFGFRLLFNSGSAYGFLSGWDGAQTLFKILTPVAVAAFVIYYVLRTKRSAFLRYSMAAVIAGAIGNYIDRLAFGEVCDFLCINVGGRAIFGSFNVADVCLTVGVAAIVIYWLFLDKEAFLRPKKKTENAAGEIAEKTDEITEEGDGDGTV